MDFYYPTITQDLPHCRKQASVKFPLLHAEKEHVEDNLPPTNVKSEVEIAVTKPQFHICYKDL